MNFHLYFVRLEKTFWKAKMGLENLKLMQFQGFSLFKTSNQAQDIRRYRKTTG